MTPQEFCDRFLPANWCERDLQLLIQKRLRKWKLLAAPDEVRIPTATTTRRSDLETWSARFEVKRWLTYAEIKGAIGQLLLYNYYGQKLLGIFPKKWVVIGLAPADPHEYEAALKLAIDYQTMGIRVIFINESPEWFPGSRQPVTMTPWLIGAAGIASFTLSVILISAIR